MTEREKFLLRMAALYLQANLSDACEAFEPDGQGCANAPIILADKPDTVDVNGEPGAAPTDDEIDQLLRTLQ